MERNDLAGRPLRLAVNTQTPLVRLRQDDLMRLAHVHLDDLVPEEDYKFTAGGVTRMLLPLLRRGLAQGRLANAEWVAMGGTEQHPLIEMPDRLMLSFVGLEKEPRRGYARVKEHAWAMLNSLPAPEQDVPGAAWSHFMTYQERSARQLEVAAKRMGGLDLLYVHDFQQMGVAHAWRGPEVPRVFHLHTPFPANMPGDWKARFADFLASYDAVVCSTTRYQRNLQAAGLKVPIHVIPPFIDPRDFAPPDEAAIAHLRERFGLQAGELTILHVGRMDPMKGQDRLIRMMPHVLSEQPQARLVLIGNGSFSSSKNGGLGLSKGQRWRAHLEKLASDLGVAERVTFTGHLDDAAVQAALASCDVFILPSTREGFGLAAVEAWRYGKPTIVSQTAGVADLVDDGSNGIIVDCADEQRLAHETLRLLRDPERAEQMGQAAKQTSRLATLPEGERALSALFQALIKEAPHARV